MAVREKVENEKRLEEMSEYIKKDELLKHKADVYDEDGHVLYAVPTGCIVAMPPADVVLVRHGRWIDKGEYAVCMECGGRSGTQYNGVEPIPLMTQFCPNCGAIMDGGAE